MLTPPWPAMNFFQHGLERLDDDHFRPTAERVKENNGQVRLAI